MDSAWFHIPCISLPESQRTVLLETFGDFEGAVDALSLLSVATLLLLVFAEERHLVTMFHSVLKLLLNLHSFS